MMYEIACNNTGLLEGRKPVESETEARAIAFSLAKERGEAFQLWDQAQMIAVIRPDGG